MCAHLLHITTPRVNVVSVYAATLNPSNPCPNSWEGIDCDAATGRITGITLAGKVLPCDSTGCALLPIFAFDGGLTALHVLNLSRTSFTADLATLDLTGMYMLKILDLSHAVSIVGALPAEWPSQMPALRELYLAGPQILVSNASHNC